MRVEGDDRKRRIKSEEKLLPIAHKEPKHYQLSWSEQHYCSVSFKRSMSSAAAAAVSRGLTAAQLSWKQVAKAATKEAAARCSWHSMSSRRATRRRSVSSWLSQSGGAVSAWALCSRWRGRKKEQIWARGKRWDGGVPQKATRRSQNHRGGWGWAAVDMSLRGAAGGVCALWGCLG
jgi:hypothetical protein